MRKLFLFILFISYQIPVFSACITGYIPTNEPNTSYKRIHCDTEVEIPTSGLNNGDFIYAADTNRLFVATSSTEVTTIGQKPPAADMTRLSTAIGVSGWASISDCNGASDAVTYNTTTHAWGCNTISSTPPADDSITAAKFADGDWGDITIATNIASVEDDSHNHTAATLATDSVSADELNATGVETELEAVLDLDQLQGTVTDAQVPNNITITNLSGTNTGDQTTVSGNAGTATILQTARNINGVSFNGSADITSYISVATLASDQATGADVNPVTLTGLVFTYAANSTYLIRFNGRVSPAAATTGCGFQFDLSSAVTDINVSFVHQLANTGTLSGGHSIADDASVGVSSGLPGTSNYPVSGFAILRTAGNTGTAQLRFRSETTAVITARAGMTMVVEKVA